MTREYDPNDDSLDEWDAGDDDSEDVEVEAPCPRCRQLVYLDAVRCPHCGEYMADEAAERPARVSNVPVWVTLTAIGMLLIILFAWIL
jgi:predicted amidophosphoribosyltransferase